MATQAVPYPPIHSTTVNGNWLRQTPEYKIYVIIGGSSAAKFVKNYRHAQEKRVEYLTRREGVTGMNTKTVKHFTISFYYAAINTLFSFHKASLK